MRTSSCADDATRYDALQSGELLVKNALSFDVEDYFHVTGCEHVVDRARWDEYPIRFKIGMDKILRILDNYCVKATFFFLGWIADRYPEVVSAVAQGGHEIGIHGYEHRLIYTQSPAEFEADLVRAIESVRKSYDGPILGYRAPTFSIRKDTLWALEIIKDFGFRYDSSVLPGRNGMNVPDVPHEILVGLLEFPISTVPLFGWRLRFAGGGYLRFYPFSITCRAIDWLNGRGRPVVVYLHPWELDAEQPRIRAGIGNTVRHRINLRRTESRLERLCERFDLAPVRKILGL
jgi:polysaccharide deacetylase family protein (PEP-CTERM system associated)